MIEPLSNSPAADVQPAADAAPPTASARLPFTAPAVEDVGRLVDLTLLAGSL